MVGQPGVLGLDKAGQWENRSQYVGAYGHRYAATIFTGLIEVWESTVRQIATQLLLQW